MKFKNLLFTLGFIVCFSLQGWADTEPDNNTSAGADAATQNDTLTGSINATDDATDWYEFTTDNDGTITITLDHDGYYMYLKLYDSDGATQLGSTGAGYIGDLITVSYGGLQAGTYYAKVERYSSYAGNYTLTTALTNEEIANDAEPNDDAANAVLTSQDATEEGHINFRANGGTYDTYDYYVFTTNGDGTIKLTLVHNGYYAYVRLYDSDGTTALGSEVAGYVGDSITVSVYGLAAGTYYIRVRGYSSGSAGYTLINELIPNELTNDTEPNNDAANAITLAQDASTEGHINFRSNGGTYDGYDFYEVTTNNDGTIKLTMVHNGYYAYVRLYDSDGTTALGSEVAGYVGDSITVSVYGLAAGTYYIRVRGYSSGSAGYTLINELILDEYSNDTEVNDTYSTAQAMETNSSTEGHINFRYNGGSLDTYDYHAVTISNTGDLTVTLDHNGYYAYLRLYDTDGTTALTSEAAGYVGDLLTVSATDLAPGTYYIRVRGYSGYNAGYVLTNTYCPDDITIIAEGETTLCEGESVILSTEDHHLSYLWSDGSTTETIAALLDDEYSLTIDNGSGCVRSSNTLDIEVTPNPVAIIDADGPTEFCDGGDVTLSVSETPDSYLWSDGSTDPTLTATETGDYSVQLFKNGCTALSDPVHVTVNENPTPTISADGPTTFCDGGSVTLTSSAAASYLWSDGSTGSSVLADASGDYSVTVTDDNGCSGTSATTTVTENANPVADISADGPTEFCSGGSVNLTASGGTSYLWSNGETTSSINVTASGDYSCTVTNAAGCSDVSSVISVTVTACGSVSISADGPTEFCEGGSVMLTSSEPTGNVWSTGETTQSITVSTSGDYYCENDGNTSNTISVTVNANPEATISADGPTTFCDGGSVTLTASAAVSYLWSDGSTGSSVVADASGDYSVTVTDANGCSGTSAITTVTENANPTPTISADGPTTFCDGSVNLNIDGSYSSYAWSNGETTASINVTSSGSYSVTVTDDNGCSGTSNSIEVEAGASPTVSAVSLGGNHICYGGTIEISATASAGNLQWYKNDVMIAGETGSSYFATTPGKYTCVATDGSCSATSNIVVIKKHKIVTLTPAGAQVLCPGSTTIEFTVPFYAGASYQWYKNDVMIAGETGTSYTATDGGIYYCIITISGCQRISEKAAVSESCREMGIAQTQFSLFPNPAMDNTRVEFTSAADEDITLTITDMTGKIISQETMSVLHGVNSIDINTHLIPSGVYMLSLTNASNNTSFEKLVIEK